MRIWACAEVAQAKARPRKMAVTREFRVVRNVAMLREKS